MAHLTEEWKPVVGYEDVYYVSNLGNIRRICPHCGPTHYWPRKYDITRQGYARFTLHRCVNDKKPALVHVLIAASFLGPRPEGHVVNHKDGNKKNNRLDNLEYVTFSGNHIHAVLNGLRPAMKLDAAKVRQIRELQGVLGSTPVARQFGITKTHVQYIWNRKAWAHLPD